MLSTSVKRFSDSTDFFEALNLFIMFCAALGLATAVAVTEFLEYTVFDTIRMRGKTWQVRLALLPILRGAARPRVEGVRHLEAGQRAP